ncbi:tryptophan-rich sensory protein [Exiguobacterium sp. KRL4]|uniref:TspO/MBR family protein n=1 Tax=Exiguobacterium sp. KRL4 TaxID=1914536 RepID=UPI0008F96B3A|nr:TspO/MBR family protein [Exiguobacterium sp. KRL4]OIN65856.1 tryptophan-rich sensory protein [Exiguobacterium sp. KRL4]
MKNKWIWLNWLGFVFTIAVNALDGGKTGRISDTISTLFKPAGYAFSIWGLIYAVLLVWLIMQTIPKFKEHEIAKKIGPWFLISCLFNAGWIVSFSFKLFPLSVVVIVGLLLSLIVIYSKIDRETKALRFKLPFSLYLGWVSVATIANIFLTLDTENINSLLGIGDAGWTMIMLGVGVIVALLFMFANRDPIYPLVFVWAYIAINFQSDNGLVDTVVLGSVVVLLAGYVFLLVRMRRQVHVSK